VRQAQLERISWDDALAEIKIRWTQVIPKYGSQDRPTGTSRSGWALTASTTTPSADPELRM
jgi:hypothetical protein